MSVAAAFLACCVFLRPGAKTDLWLKAFLSFIFAWNGVVFFLVFLKNPISMFAGAPLFIVVSLLFAVDIWTQKTHFRPPQATWKKGHRFLDWPGTPVPGARLALGTCVPAGRCCPLLAWIVAIKTFRWQ